ncbi:polyprenyl synthetase family protein [Streptomyces lavendulae]|uniref:polyprenyl synthetase family protein n=1 Tax=Streptomyces lavendulae TaxID=1914 RepID=UPI002553B0E9|nr:polyprenyl synthetase family protein [Streptomyces lavendulae]
MDDVGAVEAVLEEFLREKAAAALAEGLPGEVPGLLGDFVGAGGKRVRPSLCLLGWRAARGPRGDPRAIRVAASLELFHAFALIHDDLMDHSDTRRGRPTLQHFLTARHQVGRTHTAAARLGAAAALLAGDVALAWSAELLHTAGLTHAQLATALGRTDAMRTQVMYGQYLDLLSTGRPGPDTGIPWKVIRCKTAGYTFVHPLLLGAELAGAGSALTNALAEYGWAAGEAFQLGDDLLGVFGRPDETGKPNGDDLREGKHTLLAALAYERADAVQRAALDRHLGDAGLDEDGACRLREVLTATGAHDAVRRTVRERCRAAVQALEGAPVPEAVRRALTDLAAALASRTS